MRKEIFCAFIRGKIKAVQKFNCWTFTWFYDEKENDHERTRTLNLPIRSRTPCPLGHAARHMRKEIFCAFIRARIKAIQKFNWSTFTWFYDEKENDHEGTQTLNLPIGSQTPCPLGHAARHMRKEIFCAFIRGKIKAIQKFNWCTFTWFYDEKENDHEGTRTLNLPIRSRTPCPLGHAARHMRKEIFCAFIRGKIKAIQKFNWCTFTWFYDEKENDREGTRTLNLPIRSRTPCPIGHAARHMRKEIFCAFIRGKIKAIQKFNCCTFTWFYDEKKNDHEGTQTLNLPIRSRTPCPLGHAAKHMRKEIFCSFIRVKIKGIQKFNWCTFTWFYDEKENDQEGTQTLNLPIRSRTPSALVHTARHMRKEIFCAFILGKIKAIQKFNCCTFSWFYNEKENDHKGTRTLNLLIRSRTPCPLGHAARHMRTEIFCAFIRGKIKGIQKFNCCTFTWFYDVKENDHEETRTLNLSI